MRAWVLMPLVAVLLLVGGCAGEEDTVTGGSGGGAASESSAGGDPASRAGGEVVSIDSGEAIVWGEGDYAAILSHGAAYDAASWEEQGKGIAEEGMVALAVEDTSAQSIAAAAEYLRQERGVEGVALVGASAGTGGVLGAAESDPELPDQLILLSGTGEVSGLGEYPKLFVASEGEGLAERVRQMAEQAPGDQNEALVLPGDAHAQAIFRSEAGERLTQALLERLRRYA